MPILNFNINSMGQSGVTPSIIYINTSDTIATVTTAGYLNALSKANVGINDSDMALITTQTSPSSTTKQVKWYEVEKVGDNWSLVNAGSGITAVVEDLTPELGGNLDGGGFDITNVASLEATDLKLGATTLIDGIIDDDTMATASATTAATSESIKAYVDGASSAPTSGTNLVIGGNYTTNPWQRGTTFGSISNGGRSADRIRYLRSGTGAITITQDTDAPTAAEAAIYSEECFKIAVATADASLAAGDYYRVSYNMEGYDFTQIAQRIFTVSFWVKASKTGIYCISFNNSISDRSYVSEYTISSANTWEKKSVTISASPSAGTWNYTNGLGLSVNFMLAAGTTYQTTADTWQAGNYLTTSNQVNAMDNTANTFKIQLLQVEEGAVATPFELRTRAEDLALCQRYFQKTYAEATAPASSTTVSALGYYVSTAGVSNNGITWQRKVTMRNTPTIVTYGTSAVASTWRNIDDGANSGAASSVNNGGNSTVIKNLQVAGDGVGEFVAIHATAEAEI